MAVLGEFPRASTGSDQVGLVCYRELRQIVVGVCGFLGFIWSFVFPGLVFRVSGLSASPACEFGHRILDVSLHGMGFEMLAIRLMI